MSEGPYSPATYARERPESPALILARTGEPLTWRELDERSNRIAHLFRDLGLRVGDTVTLLIENHLRAFEVTWAVLRSGLRYTFVNSMLTADEASEILVASATRVLVTSTRRLDAAIDADSSSNIPHRFVIASHDDERPGSLPDGWQLLDDATARKPTTLFHPPDYFNNCGPMPNSACVLPTACKST